MFSSSRWIAGSFAFALALSIAIIGEPLAAQSTPQDTTHKGMKMPMDMPMGKKPQKKKAAPKTAAAKKPAAGKSSAKTTKKSVPATAGKKRAPAQQPHLIEVPMGAQPHHAPAKVRQTQAVDSTQAMHGDSAHGKMGDMKMHPAPTKSDSMKMPGMPGMDMPSKPSDSTRIGMPSMQPHSAEGMMVGPAGVSMERMGSGTTWIPDAVTLPSRNRMLHDWMIMTHGFVFAQYDHQSGERGDDQFGSLNWVMLMATRHLGGGQFQARTMLSLDPWTVSNRGYPLLLQSGETYNGEPLHDRQHPHDFWMELGALYQREIRKGLAWSIYAAPSGEPALSPVAFMHRPSAMDNPAAPLNHHWQDATHVSFGVLTTGIFSQRWLLEGSVFNGREPDENRWNFDPIKLDSYSGRLTINPTAHWSLAGGYGYLKSPESLNPDETTHRMTASVLHGSRLGADGQWASAFIWGANKHGSASWSNGILAESEAILDRKNTVFGRTELVQKSAEDLVVDIPVFTRNGTLLPGFPASQRFNVGALQLGYIRELARAHWATIGLGAAGTLNFVPAPLEPYYGSRNPTGIFVFLRMRPFHSTRSMNDMGGMQMKRDHE
ncbi:MAG: hypothetical protein H7Z74_12420 [Anaerolineae bacterium]|nr:hypothetical protein [Gemmatimonadaceae bacterium]